MNPTVRTQAQHTDPRMTACVKPKRANGNVKYTKKKITKNSIVNCLTERVVSMRACCELLSCNGIYSCWYMFEEWVAWSDVIVRSMSCWANNSFRKYGVIAVKKGWHHWMPSIVDGIGQNWIGQKGPIGMCRSRDRPSDNHTLFLNNNIIVYSRAPLFLIPSFSLILCPVSSTSIRKPIRASPAERSVKNVHYYNK